MLPFLRVSAELRREATYIYPEVFIATELIADGATAMLEVLLTRPRMRLRADAASRTRAAKAAITTGDSG
jgi:hypothetical protein